MNEFRESLGGRLEVEVWRDVEVKLEESNREFEDSLPRVVELQED